MNRVTTSSMLLALIVITGIAVFAGTALSAQQPAPSASQAPTPDGYVPRGTRPGKGLAPGMKVTDLGKGGRTFRVNFTKGDEIMSGMTEFAEKYHIRNGHFTGVGAINKAIFGWSDVERGL